jgi:hypothetical protein
MDFKESLCSKCWKKLLDFGIYNIVTLVIEITKSAKCRIGEGADTKYALIPKDKLNHLKRELRKLRRDDWEKNNGL